MRLTSWHYMSYPRVCNSHLSEQASPLFREALFHIKEHVLLRKLVIRPNLSSFPLLLKPLLQCRILHADLPKVLKLLQHWPAFEFLLMSSSTVLQLIQRYLCVGTTLPH